MKYSKACIPLGGAWSSPFVRWQGALAEMSSLDLAVSVTARALRDREVPITEVSELVLGPDRIVAVLRRLGERRPERYPIASRLLEGNLQ
jgi:hypothetical protein